MREQSSKRGASAVDLKLRQCVAGWLLWGGHRAGAILALVLLPFELVFWVGFSLPYGPVLAAGRTALILISWWAMRGNS